MTPSCWEPSPTRPPSGSKKAELIERLTMRTRSRTCSTRSPRAQSRPPRPRRSKPAAISASRTCSCTSSEPRRPRGQPVFSELAPTMEAGPRRLGPRALFDSRPDRLRGLVPLPTGKEDGVERLRGLRTAGPRSAACQSSGSARPTGAASARRRMRGGGRRRAHRQLARGRGRRRLATSSSVPIATSCTWSWTTRPRPLPPVGREADRVRPPPRRARPGPWAVHLGPWQRHNQRQGAVRTQHRAPAAPIASSALPRLTSPARTCCRWSWR